MRVVVLALVVACTAGEQSIVDTSHAPFALQTDGSITAVAGTPAAAPCASGRPLYAWSLGRFITISSACSTDTGWSSAGNLERPLACDSTANCPQWRTWSFECRSGVCQNVDATAFPPVAIDWDIAYELCFAPVPRPDTIDLLSPASIAAYDAVTTACPSPTRTCTLPLPSACLQL